MCMIKLRASIQHLYECLHTEISVMLLCAHMVERAALDVSELG